MPPLQETETNRLFIKNPTRNRSNTQTQANLHKTLPANKKGVNKYMFGKLTAGEEYCYLF